jgi:peptidoglycan/LPS O-acetylase OafA/YrhL
VARSDRRRDIQGLRALAVLLVVAYHAGAPLPGGFTGVDVFFAISGFVIARALIRELASTGGLRLGRFYARRVRRLLPALAVMLIAVALLGTLASPVAGQRMGGLTGIRASLFAANVYLYHLGTGYFDVSASLDPLLHTWTLAVEEQFYLVFPALLLLGWRLGRRLAAVLLVGAVSAGSFYLALEYSQAFGIGGVAHPQRFAFYASPTRAWEFGAGSLLALGSPLLSRAPLLVADGLGAAGLAWAGVGVLAIEGQTISSTPKRSSRSSARVPCSRPEPHRAASSHAASPSARPSGSATFPTAGTSGIGR